MSDNSVMCASAADKNKFAPEPGPTCFLYIPKNEFSAPKNEVAKTGFWVSLESAPTAREQPQQAEPRTFNHSWQIGNVTFANDLCETLKGDLDRMVFATRRQDGDGKLRLKQE